MLTRRRKGIQQGYGLHLWVLTPEFVPNFFKDLFAGEILYTLVLVFAKFSILAFYKRIFASTIRIPVYILTGFVTCWGVAVVRPYPQLSQLCVFLTDLRRASDPRYNIPVSTCRWILEQEQESKVRGR